MCVCEVEEMGDAQKPERVVLEQNWFGLSVFGPDSVVFPDAAMLPGPLSMRIQGCAAIMHQCRTVMPHRDAVVAVPSPS